MKIFLNLVCGSHFLTSATRPILSPTVASEDKKTLHEVTYRRIASMLAEQSLKKRKMKDQERRNIYQNFNLLSPTAKNYSGWPQQLGSPNEISTPVAKTLKKGNGMPFMTREKCTATKIVKPSNGSVKSAPEICIKVCKNIKFVKSSYAVVAIVESKFPAEVLTTACKSNKLSNEQKMNIEEHCMFKQWQN